MKNVDKFLNAISQYEDSESQEKYFKVLKELKDCEFLLPVKNINFKNRNNNKDTVILKEENVFLVYTKDNKKFIPVFTSISEKKKWNKKDIKDFIYSSSELSDLLKRLDKIDGLVIDPFSINLTFMTSDFMKSLILSQDEERVNVNENILSSLGIEFIDSKDELNTIFKKYKNIKEVYAATKGSHKKTLLLLIKYTDDIKHEIEEHVTDAVEERNTDSLKERILNINSITNKNIDITILSSSDKEEKNIYKKDFRIYKKKKFLFF